MPNKARFYCGIALLSAAILMFELLLTRLFAVAEWYHFAFLSVSVALLGYACSGTILALVPLDIRPRLIPVLGVGLPMSLLGAYWVVNKVPFDSYQLAWDRRQIAYLIVYYLSLVVPFVIGGLIVAHWLAWMPRASNAVYAANLIGSALGGLVLLGTLPGLGGEGSVVAATCLSAVGSALMLSGSPIKSRHERSAAVGAISLAIVGLLLIAIQPGWLTLRLSPYKSLSYALQAPSARLAYRKWNVFSRVDVVESQQIHSAPGLSLKYKGKLPLQYGLTVDGGDLSPLSQRITEEDRAFLAYLPASVPYRLRPQASAMILYPRGGMDVAVALQLGAARVVVIEDNPLIVHVMRDLYGPFTGQLYRDPRVVLRVEDGRSALQRSQEPFDIVHFSLTESYHPIFSGSYSLSENHLYTVEAVMQALRRTNARGLLVITRWLQELPSEPERAIALVITALERLGMSPRERLMAFRSWSTLTILASPSPFTPEDIALVRRVCDELGYDMVYYEGMSREEANRYNRLPQPQYYDAFQSLLSPGDRAGFYRAQFHDITPPTDDRPFFGHYFRWRQVPQIIAQLGKTWQPFGGSGFLLVLALLGMAILAAALLVMAPLYLRRGLRGTAHLQRVLVYFAALGLGYLLVEIPLMQQFILYLGQPTFAFILVLSALLLSSGLGSMIARRANLRIALWLLLGLLLVYPWALRGLFAMTLGLSLVARVAIAIVCLLPLGLLMGIPFAGGIAKVEQIVPGLIPWIWAINGSASVVSSILAAVIALSGGYGLVIGLATACYGVAMLAFWPWVTQRTWDGSSSSRSNARP